MPKTLLVIAILLWCVAFCPRQALALNMSPSTPPKPRFVYKDASGKLASADVVGKYYPKKIVQPFAKVDSHIDPKLCRAATIAEERARAHSHCLCWRFVKEALVAAGVVNSRPQTPFPNQRSSCWQYSAAANQDPLRSRPYPALHRASEFAPS